MGVHGWRILSEDQVLWGRMVDWNLSDQSDFPFGVGADYDWNLLVVPEAEYQWLLKNPAVDQPNHNGVLECEIKPPDRAGSVDTKDLNTLANFLGRLLQAGRVRIRGAWVADCSHSYSGNNLEFENCDRGKTEIHPIYTISSVIRDRRVDVKHYYLYAFRETKGNHPLRGRAVNETFSIECPLGQWTLALERGDGRVVTTPRTDANGNTMLDVEISVDSSQGLSFAVIDVPVPSKGSKEKEKEIQKDSKENKDDKEVAKDKDREVDFDRTERETDLGTAQKLDLLTARVEEIERRLEIPSGEAFIDPEQRPPVGEEAPTKSSGKEEAKGAEKSGGKQ